MKRVAIIGAGISGLTAANVLDEKGYESYIHNPDFYGSKTKFYDKGSDRDLLPYWEDNFASISKIDIRKKGITEVTLSTQLNIKPCSH